MKVIYTDVDGTLVGPGGCLFLGSNRSYTLEPAKTIVTALERGVDIVMVSGRNRHQLREDARIMGFKNYVAELGAELIYNLGERIVPNVKDFEAGEDTVYEAIRKRGIVELLFSKFAGRLEYHTPWSKDKRYYSHLLRGLVDTSEVDRFLEENGSQDLKIVDNGSIWSRGETLEVSEVRAYHLLPKSVDKVSAIRRDQQERRIKQDKCIAIGDSKADLPMAGEVKTLYIVANAFDDDSLNEELKKYDNVVVTKGSRGLGWSEAVRSVLKS